MIVDRNGRVGAKTGRDHETGRAGTWLAFDAELGSGWPGLIVRTLMPSEAVIRYRDAERGW
jgi:hypothetical protein